MLLDHVALLIKKGDNLFVYETIQKDGCKLRPWGDFVRYNWNLLYEKIVFREIIVDEEYFDSDQFKSSLIDNKDKDKKNDNDSIYSYNEGIISKKKYNSKYEEIKDSIHEFVKITEHKEYRLSCDKLFCYCQPKKYEVEKKWNECKGFYCSQLVAGAFMHSEIMKTNNGAGKYLPGSFSALKPYDYLSLNDGFHFGPEKIVVFNTENYNL